MEPQSVWHDNFCFLIGARATSLQARYAEVLPAKLRTIQPQHTSSLAAQSSVALLQQHGDFRCAWYDASSAQLCFAVSAFNPLSIFYCQVEDCVLVSTDVDEVIDLLRYTQGLHADSLALSQWLLGRPDPHQSMLTGLSQIPPAHWLSLDLNAPKANASVRFWDIDPHLHIRYSNPRDYQEELAAILGTSITRRTQQHPHIATQMSGGMDSTTISALTHQLTQASGQQHTVISHRYPNTQACDEDSNILAMCDHINFAQHSSLDMGRFASLPFVELYPTHRHNPGVVLSPKYDEEAKYLAAKHVSVVLTGNGGDEMFWGHSHMYLERLLHGQIRVLPEVFKAARVMNYPLWRIIKETFLAPYLKYTLRGRSIREVMQYQPRWLGDKAKAVLAKHQLHNPMLGQSLSRQFRYHGLFYTATYNSMRAYAAVAQEYGITVAHPMMDKDVAQFSFAIPSEQLLHGQYPKYVLRQTMSEHLPSKVCWDTHKTTFDSHFKLLVQHSADWIRTLLNHPDMDAMGLVDNAILLSEFNRMLADPNAPLNVDMLYAILCQSWYQDHIANQRQTPYSALA